MNLTQLFSLAALRYKLAQHQRYKAGLINVILSRILRALLAIFAILAFIMPATFVPGLIGDVEACKLVAFWNYMVMFFLFCAMLSLAGQLQLNEAIPIERLLHLPVSLNGAFLFSYLCGLANPLMLMFAPAMLGFTIGVIVAKGLELFVLLPALLAIFFATTSLFHLLKAISARVMHNKRHRALIVAFVSFCLVIGFVLFLSTESVGGLFGTSGLPGDVVRSWAAWKPGLYSILGIVVLGCGNQYFSYRSLVKFHTGADSFKASGRGQQSVKAWPSDMVFRQLPFVSTQASAVATTGFRNITRAPEALMALIPPVIAVLLGSPYLAGIGNSVIPDVIRPWIQVIIITVTMFGFPAFLFLTFSFDRDGFRAYIISPLDRVNILYGKNLAVGIPTFISGIVLLAIAEVFLRNGLILFLASLLQLTACFFAMCMLGNFLSIWFPVGLKRGKIKPTNAPLIHTILLYAGILLAPVLVVQPAMLFIFLEMLSVGSLGINGWIYLLLTLIQLVATWLLYRWTLEPLGSWLWQREPTILNVVSSIPE